VVCAAAEVEVDEETGAILITKLVTVGDIGKALNPQHVEMQDEGAAVMGLGHTLMEHLIMDDSGRILNLGTLDYRIPTTQDLPLEMHSLVVENGDGPGPFGAKGTGESGILAIAPAVGAAVNEATGLVIRDLPLTPERVWQALVEKRP
jgi:CO/xanthine dehydrogenase Mo-binding subunit